MRSRAPVYPFEKDNQTARNPRVERWLGPVVTRGVSILLLSTMALLPAPHVADAVVADEAASSLEIPRPGWSMTPRAYSVSPEAQRLEALRATGRAPRLRTLERR